MSSTFDTVANIVSETCDIPRDTIKPESHIDDLGIDSLDVLGIALVINKAFGIMLPLDDIAIAVNDGKATWEQYLVLRICVRGSTISRRLRGREALWHPQREGYHDQCHRARIRSFRLWRSTLGQE